MTPRPSGTPWRARLPRLGRPSRATVLRGTRRAVVPVVGWLVVSIASALLVFLNSTTTTVLVGHETTVRPTLDGHASIELGPYLPGLRYPLAGRVGAELVLGRTTARSYDELLERYAVIASQPQGQIERVRAAVVDVAQDAALDGALIGLSFPVVWMLVGRRRRRELLHAGWRRTGVALLVVGALVVVALRPWEDGPPRVGESRWRPVTDVLPAGVPVPEEVAPLQVDADLLTAGTRSLITSALDTYRSSHDFYGRIVEAVPDIADQLRSPAEDETVALLVSDRHDNVGMDPVARAIGDAGGASILLDLGDDTSVGGSWEAFSLDSLDSSFADWEHRYVALGNHDHGDFVPVYLESLGFHVLDGEVVEVEDGIRLMGVPDPRSSGLGSWREEPGISFDAQRRRLAEAVCAADAEGERISTLVVHDANLGNGALAAGCVDLVVGGHLHVQEGPNRVEADPPAPTDEADDTEADDTEADDPGTDEPDDTGTDGDGAAPRVGYSYTNGTTGGAAYALALGSKLRREAQVSLVTYREGRPIGVQPVDIRTTGQIVVQDWVPLDLGG